MTYAYTIDGQTLLKNINELLPGHRLTYDISEKSLKIEKYWDLRLEKNTFAENENFDQVKKLLENAIDKRKVSDAPIGALLSGGLDSSVMVAMLTKLTDSPVQTFTTGFGNELDEFDEAQIVAEHCKTNHTEILIDFSDLTKSLPKILWHMEFPFGRPSILSNYMVSEAIKKYVTVAYTGEGSDELFGGYNRYVPYAKDPEYFKKEDNLESISSGFFKNKEFREEVFSNNVLQYYKNENHPSNIFQKSIQSNINHSALNNALLFELKTEIPGAQTWRIDRTSSAHAVELREPFLDYKLVEFCASIPSHLKINKKNNFTKKYILQKIASELLPEKIVKRKKFPWGIPFYDYFKKEFLPIAQNVIDKSMKNKRDYINMEYSKLESLTNKINNSNIKNSKDKEIDDNILRQTMFLFNLEIWHQIFLDGDNFKNPVLDINKFI